MKLTKIEIKNWRNIKEATIDFTSNKNGSEKDIKWNGFEDIGSGKIVSDVYAIIGANSVGKTSVLDAIWYASFLSLHGFEKEADAIFAKNSDGHFANNAFPFSATPTVSRDSDAYKEFVDDLALRDFMGNAMDFEKPIEFKAYFDGSKEPSHLSLFKTVLTRENSSLWSGNEVYKMNKKNFHISESGIFDYKNGSIFQVLVSGFGLKRSLKIARIADPKIIDIYKDGKLVFVKMKNGSSVSIENVSTGTKFFIEAAINIINSNKKGNGIFIIDEIDSFMHAELSRALIMLVKMVSEREDSTSFIFTTHNMSVLTGAMSNKQVLEVINDGEETRVEKLSKTLKPNSSLSQKYDKGVIAPFPSKAFAYDSLVEVLNE